MDPLPHGYSAAGPTTEAPTRPDRLAVALGNASLLGIGYLLLGRRTAALANACGSIVLLAMLAVLEPPTWWLRGVLLVVWAATIVHGRILAGRDSAPPEHVRPVAVQRLIAAATVIAVLLAFVGLRLDARRIEQAAAADHREGACARALGAWDRFGRAHQVADGTTAVRAREAEQACALLMEAESVADDDPLRAEDLLRRYEAHAGALWAGAPARRADLLIDHAEVELERALHGAQNAEDGFSRLATALHLSPDRERRIREVLDGFLDELVEIDPCRRRGIVDDLSPGLTVTRAQEGDDVLDSAYAALEKVAPAAILACADDVRPLDPRTARRHYREMLDRYPDHPLAARAERGLVETRQAIELEKVRELLRPPYDELDRPAYCDGPAPFSAAPPYEGKGPHRVMLFGNDHETAFPTSWRADDAADAVLIVCAGEHTYGTAVETCPYENERAVGGASDVTFHRVRIPVRVFEVRTGRLVTETTVEIDGASCPEQLAYETYVPYAGPPPDVYVEPSTSDIRKAYASLVRP